MKRCVKCGHPKERDEFYSLSSKKCKECVRDEVRQNRLSKLEYYREYDIKRAKLPHRIELNTSVVSRYRLSHPDRYRANNAVNNAVRDGRLHKPKYCSRCGRFSKTIHGHHEDYSKPLEVEWLCVVCHSDERKKEELTELNLKKKGVRVIQNRQLVLF